jgi:predicted short-subunit dehydrogenase-like oxidoreductase (DUF2520 family)
MPESPAFRQIGLVGAGRVASALALGLAPHGARPALVLGRGQIAGTGAARDAADLLARCDTIGLAVSDDALDGVVADLAAAMGAKAPFVFHVSGRSGVGVLAPLADRGAQTAAIHPVMTFTGDPAAEVARMVGARFAVTGADAASTALARRIVACLGGVAVDVAEAHRALYHAALCHAANHLVTLLAGSSEALARAGVDDPAALLAPLVRAALNNSLDRGFAALSGPLLRGDGRTIANHLAALARDCPDLLPAYRAMALATLDQLDRTGALPDPALRATIKDAP